jgi:hypothetical protein
MLAPDVRGYKWRRKRKRRPKPPFLGMRESLGYSSGTSSKATMLMILINGLIAGPAVSL